MDDKRFVKCVLTDCKLVYGGGDVTWENTQFVNCQLTFDGAAQRTVAYLQNFGLMKPPVTKPPLRWRPIPESISCQLSAVIVSLPKHSACDSDQAAAGSGGNLLFRLRQRFGLNRQRIGDYN